jgi:CRP-like cAMP-binding protein
MTIIDDSRFRANLLLAAIDPQQLAELAPHLERVQLAQGDVLFDSGDELGHLWFPETSVVSLTIAMVEGGSSEAATIGREGAVGLLAALSSRLAISRAVVRVPGGALRLRAPVLQAVFDASPQVRHRCLCYVDALLGQVLQSSACSALHTVEARLCRSLLQLEDRMGEDGSLPMTHDFLAQMLGVHRTTVTLAAGILQRTGVIDYARGRVTVLDRAQLEAMSCECYAVIRDLYRRLRQKPS